MSGSIVDDATDEPEPGWYPDPTADGRERWWDGVEWTNHTQAETEDVVEPEPEPAPELTQEPEAAPAFATP